MEGNEFVVKSDAVNKFGVKMLDSINNMSFNPVLIHCIWLHEKEYQKKVAEVKNQAAARQRKVDIAMATAQKKLAEEKITNIPLVIQGIEQAKTTFDVNDLKNQRSVFKKQLEDIEKRLVKKIMVRQNYKGRN